MAAHVALGMGCICQSQGNYRTEGPAGDRGRPLAWPHQKSPALAYPGVLSLAEGQARVKTVPSPYLSPCPRL